MSAVGRCGAAGFVRAVELSALPRRLCCALALLGAPAEIICEADPSGSLLWPDPDADAPPLGSPSPAPEPVL
jgi:hypothetical protein